MKYLLITFFLFLLGSDKKTDYNYNLLIGSWSQKSIANTTSTGVFTFKKDSTASLEMRNGKTDGNDRSLFFKKIKRDFENGFNGKRKRI